jgi:hypothetical protein
MHRNNSRNIRVEAAHVIASLSYRDMNRSTLLNLASREGQLVTTHFLINHRADVNTRDMILAPGNESSRPMCCGRAIENEVGCCVIRMR